MLICSFSSIFFSLASENLSFLFWLMIQFSTEELVKEVENSIAEFKRHKQEYDEERVREQVRAFSTVI